ncbi:MAG TPA: transporter [Bacteroidales bacterium]|nr:transporter [Bacteroidales bacterium]
MKIILFILFVLYSINIIAQDTIPPLVTDRPDQAESASVVPWKYLQIETGFLKQNDRTDNSVNRSFAYNTTLFRYGLLKNLEFRLGVDYLGNEIKTVSTGDVNKFSGLSPVYTGFKIKIGNEKCLMPSLAFLAGIIMPFTAGSYYKTESTAADMKFAFANTLTDHLSVGYNVGVMWDGDTTIPDYHYSVSFGINLSGRWDAFLESYGYFPGKGKNEHLADAGLTWKLLPNLQFDISGGIGLNKPSPDNFIGVGLTCRIPR